VLWKECNPMDERLKFIARLLDGEKMAWIRTSEWRNQSPLHPDRAGPITPLPV
jgi:hypothetical protein